MSWKGIKTPTETTMWSIQFEFSLSKLFTWRVHTFRGFNGNRCRESSKTLLSLSKCQWNQIFHLHFRLRIHQNTLSGFYLKRLFLFKRYEEKKALEDKNIFISSLLVLFSHWPHLITLVRIRGVDTHSVKTLWCTLDSTVMPVSQNLSIRMKTDFWVKECKWLPPSKGRTKSIQRHFLKRSEGDGMNRLWLRWPERRRRWTCK